MANKIKEELIEIIDELMETAPSSKKPGLEKARNGLKRKIIPDNRENLDKAAYYLFLLTNGFNLMTEENKERIHQLEDTIGPTLEETEKLKESEKNRPPSGNT